MPAPLPILDGSTLSYARIEFDCLHSSRVTARALPDDSRRTIKAVEITLDVTATITPSALEEGGDELSVDELLDILRLRLQTPRAELKYSNKGFGELEVNVPGGSVLDVDFGPKPKLLSFRPIGSNLAAIIEWQCTTTIPEGGPNTKFFQSIMQFCYEMNWAIDRHGYHVIVYSGFVEIPLQSPGRDDADRYRERVTPKADKRFQREHNFKLSNDRKRLDFMIKDTQLPTALPTGTTACEVRWRVKSAGGAYSDAFFRWVCTMTATITVLPQFPRKQTYLTFTNILASRLKAANAQRVSAPANSLTPDANGAFPGDSILLGGQLARDLRNFPPGSKPSVFISDVEYDEDVLGIHDRFVATCVVLGCPIRDILRVSGMWRPIDASAEEWKEVDQKYASHPRGNLRIKYNPNADILIDLTHPETANSLPPQNPSTIGASLPPPNPRGPGA